MSVLSSFVVTVLFLSQAKAYVDEPKGCLRSEKLPCAVRATGAGEQFSFKRREAQAQWLSAKKASWILDEQGFKFISGQIWIQSSTQFPVRTNSVATETNGEFWLENSEEQTKLINLSGESLELKLISTSEKHTLPVGFENWFSGLDSSGKASHGVLRTVDKVQFFKDWARKLKVTDAFAKEKIAEWREQWQNLAILSSELYSSAVKRAIAQEEQRKLELAQARERKLEDERKLRKMFRARNGFED